MKEQFYLHHDIIRAIPLHFECAEQGRHFYNVPVKKKKAANWESSSKTPRTLKLHCCKSKTVFHQWMKWRATKC
jgi:hypothetical protein